jgi:hypothetical protein
MGCPKKPSIFDRTECHYEQQSIAALLPETPEEIALLRLVEAEPRHIDLIARESTLPQPVVSSTLAMLELKGLVRQIGGMHYALIREADAAYCVDSASFQLDPDDSAGFQLDPDEPTDPQLDPEMPSVTS